MRSSLSSFSGIDLPTRYDLLLSLADGGSASVHVGRLRGFAGFWRLVALKVLHRHLNEDPASREMMVEEARIASKLHHPNVVPVIDIASVNGNLLLVMDYVEGASVAELMRAAPRRVPARIAMRVAIDACAGLDAAHTLRDAAGRSLDLVHRDVSPQNILAGVDGITRLADFGIAKLSSGKGRSGAGTLRGKVAYMAPEYILGDPASPGSDVFGLAVVIWEMLSGCRLFRASHERETLQRVLQEEAPLVSKTAPEIGTFLDDVIAMALAKDPRARFRTARAFGAALELVAGRAGMIATPGEVRDFVLARVGPMLSARRARIGKVLSAEVSAQSAACMPSPSPREEVTSRQVPRPAGRRARHGMPAPPSRSRPNTAPPPPASAPASRPSSETDDAPALSRSSAPATSWQQYKSWMKRNRGTHAIAIAAFVLGSAARALWASAAVESSTQEEEASQKGYLTEASPAIRK